MVADFAIAHTAEGWQRWREPVAALEAENLAVCLETSQGMVVEQLLESGVTVYPIAPVSSKAYRERQAPSGTQTDRLDAWRLADALRLDGHSWKALAKEDPLIAELRLLCRDEIALIEERTALLNQLQSALQEYYPAALEAFEDWRLPAAWAFGEVFPTPAALAGAGKRKWEKFLHVHKLARPQTYAKPLEIFARGSELAARGGAHPQQEPAGARPHPEAAGAPTPDRGLPCRDREALCSTPRSPSLRFAARSRSEDCPALVGRNWLRSRPL